MSDSDFTSNELPLALRCLAEELCIPDTAPWNRLREAADEIERLRAVALAARALVRTARPGSLGLETELVSEPALTALESALAAAGYDLTDEEFEERLTEEGSLP